MNQNKNILFRPYPFKMLDLNEVRFYIVIGIFVAFFLIVFQPFGISLWQTPFKILKLSGYGFASFLMPLILLFLRKLITSSFVKCSKLLVDVCVCSSSWKTFWKKFFRNPIVILKYLRGANVDETRCTAALKQNHRSRWPSGVRARQAEFWGQKSGDDSFPCGSAEWLGGVTPSG